MKGRVKLIITMEESQKTYIVVTDDIEEVFVNYGDAVTFIEEELGFDQSQIDIIDEVGI